MPNVANGLPVMRFDGGDTVRFTTRLTTIRTVFWVVSTAEVAGGSNCEPQPAGGRLRAYRMARGLRGAGDDLGRRTRRPAVRDGLTSVNGVAVPGTTTPRPTSLSVVSVVTTGNVSAQKFGEANSSQPWLGDLAELIVYDRALTETERKQVEDYLNAKYRLFIR